MGIEPTTSALRKPRSTAELPRREPPEDEPHEAQNLPHSPVSPLPHGKAAGPCPRPAIIPAVHYLVDGYNLAHWLAGDEDMLPTEMRHLLYQALAGRLPHDAESVHIYWDVRRANPHLAAQESMGWCTAYNVPDADAAIIDAIYATEAPSRCIVVSHDREVTGKCRQLGAKAWRAEDLLGDLGGGGDDDGRGRSPGGGRGGSRSRGRKGRRR